MEVDQPGTLTSDSLPLRHLSAAQRGDRGAINALLSDVNPDLTTVLGRLIQDPASVEDLRQEAWLRIVDGLPTWVPRRKRDRAGFDPVHLIDPEEAQRLFKAWAKSIARNLALDHLRVVRPNRLPDDVPASLPPDAKARSAAVTVSGEDLAAGSIDDVVRNIVLLPDCQFVLIAMCLNGLDPDGMLTRFYTKGDNEAPSRTTLYKWYERAIRNAGLPHGRYSLPRHVGESLERIVYRECVGRGLWTKVDHLGTAAIVAGRHLAGVLRLARYQIGLGRFRGAHYLARYLVDVVGALHLMFIMDAWGRALEQAAIFVRWIAKAVLGRPFDEEEVNERAHDLIERELGVALAWIIRENHQLARLLPVNTGLAGRSPGDEDVRRCELGIDSLFSSRGWGRSRLRSSSTSPCSLRMAG